MLLNNFGNRVVKKDKKDFDAYMRKKAKEQGWKYDK